MERRFIADSMLGRLARWLRLLGLDTLYYPDIEDGDLLRLTLREGRFLLTRDSHFMRMKNLKSLYLVRSNSPLEQLREVITRCGITGYGEGRCARCNGILQHVPEKGTVRDAVPEYVFLNCNSFFLCHSCGRVYWEGTHLKRFRSMIGNIVQQGAGDNASG
ncbi:MAG TPA: Mut7-C RNAse domain-containing protein [Thermodesulfovibrionales bacterium]|nr:Mut7-C RNAse domain-containing protein [Thermodesulfovibrionales bacterium]